MCSRSGSVLTKCSSWPMFEVKTQDSRPSISAFPRVRDGSTPEKLGMLLRRRLFHNDQLRDNLAVTSLCCPTPSHGTNLRMPPKGPVTVARNGPPGSGGVLPINPANTQPQQPKSAVRLKLEVRRLPPGLTQDEFEQAFGDDWKKGSGRVDWLEYRQGKMKR